ncbi:uncharacterized protein LOC142358114, partial [Convolutriloba macropyga]|uniref:uncharacterized protein LOC142358114 n=1 Tax=Convolutriloba macropyga TaxID=536237 RepID=UPI003F51E5E0
MFRNWSARSSLLSSSLTSLSSLTSYSSSSSWSHQKVAALSTALHDAAAVGALTVLSRASRQQLSAKDSSGRTPGMIAAEKGNLEALILINKRGGKLDKQDYLGDFALHLAAKNDNSECVKYLLTAKHASCNPFALDDQKLTPRETAELTKATKSAEILAEFERELKNRNPMRAHQMQREAERLHTKYKQKRDQRVEQCRYKTNRNRNSSS